MLFSIATSTRWLFYIKNKTMIPFNLHTLTIDFIAVNRLDISVSDMILLLEVSSYEMYFSENPKLMRTLIDKGFVVKNNLIRNKFKATAKGKKVANGYVSYLEHNVSGSDDLIDRIVNNS